MFTFIFKLGKCTAVHTINKKKHTYTEASKNPFISNWTHPTLGKQYPPSIFKNGSLNLKKDFSSLASITFIVS